MSSIANRRHVCARLGFAFAFAWWLLVASSTVRGAAAQTSGTTAKPASVTMKDLAFVPKIVRVAAGTTVVWTNEDDVSHTVTSGTTADTGKWVSSPLLPYGKSFRVRFDRAGAFPYFCKPHFYDESMHGIVIVTRHL